MSDSPSEKRDRSPASAIGLVFVVAVILRVWYVAEQLRSHFPSSMSSQWVDSTGTTQTITLSTSPGGSFDDFLVEYDRKLQGALRQFPRKP